MSRYGKTVYDVNSQAKELNDTYSEFENMIERRFGEELRLEYQRLQKVTDPDELRKSLPARLWGSLSNVEWYRKDKNKLSVGYSFRAAGGLIADIIGKQSSYLDWYCSGDAGVVDTGIGEIFDEEGWRPKLL